MNEFRLDYTLTPKEIYSALAGANIVPKRGAGRWIRTLLLIVVMGIVAYNMTIDVNYVKIGIVLEAICVILLVLIWALPAMAKKSALKNVGSDLHINAFLRPGVISFDDGTDILLDGTSTIEDYPKDRIIIIYPQGDKDKVYIIPYRAVEFDQFDEFKQTLLSTTDTPDENIKADFAPAQQKAIEAPVSAPAEQQKPNTAQPVNKPQPAKTEDIYNEDITEEIIDEDITSSIEQAQSPSSKDAFESEKADANNSDDEMIIPTELLAREEITVEDIAVEEAQPVSEPVEEAIPEVVAEPASEAAPKTDEESTAEPAPKADEESTVEPAPKADEESTAEPAPKADEEAVSILDSEIFKEADAPETAKESDNADSDEPFSARFDDEFFDKEFKNLIDKYL